MVIRNNKLNNNLRRCRFESGEISQQELANMVGVTRLTIHSIETGKFNPSVKLALKIADYFNKSVEEIAQEFNMTERAIKDNIKRSSKKILNAQERDNQDE